MIRNSTYANTLQLNIHNRGSQVHQRKIIVQNFSCQWTWYQNIICCFQVSFKIIDNVRIIIVLVKQDVLLNIQSVVKIIVKVSLNSYFLLQYKYKVFHLFGLIFTFKSQLKIKKNGINLFNFENYKLYKNTINYKIKLILG